MFKFNSLIPRIWLKINGVSYGKGLKLVGWPFIFKFKDANILIGDRVNINSGFFSNLLGLYQRTIIIAKNSSSIKIGNNVGMSGVTIYAWKRIVIGDNCVIGANVKIVDNDFHPIEAQKRNMNLLDAVGVEDIVIGDNVFIGMNSVILKGTVLGDNCVVGAGSVVSGIYEEGAVIVGNPAKIIKYLT